MKPDPPGPVGSRYQNWKFQVVVSARIIPWPELAGGWVKSTRREAEPVASARIGGFSRIRPPGATHRNPSPNGTSCCAGL